MTLFEILTIIASILGSIVTICSVSFGLLWLIIKLYVKPLQTWIQMHEEYHTHIDKVYLEHIENLNKNVEAINKSITELNKNINSEKLNVVRDYMTHNKCKEIHKSINNKIEKIENKMEEK